MAMFFKKMHRQQNDITKKDLEPVCPYCGNVLDKKPKRKTKCPFCNNDIYVRSKQSIFASTLLIREDAIAIDELKNLENYGIKDKDFIKKRRELSKKLGKEAGSTDVIWSLFNELKLKTKDLHTLSMIYYAMALFSNKEGKDSFTLLQQSAKMKLMDYKQRGVKKVKILTGGEESCEVCRRLENKVFTIKEALETMPIPQKECTHKLYDKKRGFCKCEYAPNIK
jgi:hypothetical protein